MLTEANNIEDNELFAAIRNGEKKAFDLLFLKYYPKLCAYARQFVDFHDAEEIVQDVMVWFWENRIMQVFEVSLKGYLFKAVKNRCLTLINRNGLRQRVMTTIHKDMEELYDDPDFYAVEELMDKLNEALQSMPATYREAFELNRFQRMPYKDIAVQLSLSPKTIDYRIQQALKILRVKLKDYLPLLSFLH
ncbi:MAG: RNA polymerase sigma-70 factor [Tannerella sp.]|jgi:RNA polymerase sigma-70 factor (ECF subfamily)|nr:RNA polymerase sigma-70 factor [Tannerella sp.]